ncbi:uncharacterized protein LOC135686946 [Rhopilema esculentum]|uniref:uncharacterized protein LOC135686946 n=1 Tax=Rhopilema esculentum TaxID=499914 RepID=UPI0031CF5A57
MEGRAVRKDGSLAQNVRGFDECSPKTTDSRETTVDAPIDKLGPFGRWIRHRLLASILIGTPVLVAVQVRRHPLATKILRVASLFGTEEFYGLLVCFLTWIVDIRLARLCCILMAVGFYAANFLKNSLCLPRPPSPPVNPLEPSFNTWALPSHHAVLAVVVPWYIWFYSYLHYNLTTVQYVILFCFIVTWSFSVMLSRIYLGVHSPADVVAGSLLGCLALSAWLHYDDILDRATAVSGQGAMLVPVYVIIMLFIHPRPDLETLSFTESVCMSGVAVGFVLARTMVSGPHPPFKGIIDSINNSSSSWSVIFLFMVLRFFLGGALVLTSRFLVKKMTSVVFPMFLRITGIEYYHGSSTRIPFFTGYHKGFKLPPVTSNKEKEEKTQESNAGSRGSSPWDVDVAIRFVTYTAMGYACNYIAPMLFLHLGIVV